MEKLKGSTYEKLVNDRRKKMELTTLLRSALSHRVEVRAYKLSLLHAGRWT